MLKLIINLYLFYATNNDSLRERMIKETDDNLIYLTNYSLNISNPFLKKESKHDKKIKFFYKLISNSTRNTNELWKEYSDELESFDLCINNLILENKIFYSFELLFMQIDSLENSELKKLFFIIKDEHLNYLYNKKHLVILVSYLHLLLKESKEKNALFLLNEEFVKIKTVQRFHSAIDKNLINISENFNKFKQELNKFILIWEKLKENKELNALCCFNDHRSIFIEKKSILTEQIQKLAIEIESHYHNIYNSIISNGTECEYILDFILEIHFFIGKIEIFNKFLSELEKIKFCEINEEEMQEYSEKLKNFKELKHKLPHKEYFYKLALVNYKETNLIFSWLDKKIEEIKFLINTFRNETEERMCPFLFSTNKDLSCQKNINGYKNNVPCKYFFISVWRCFGYLENVYMKIFIHFICGLNENLRELMTDLGKNVYNKEIICYFKKKEEEINKKIVLFQNK